MTLRQSSSQQRIEGTGKVPQGPWTSASYGRANGIVTVTSIAHKLNNNDELYVKPGSDDLLRTFAAGNYLITVVDEDTFTITGTGTNFIAAATSISYRSVRSLTINASDKMEFSIGSGADEEDAIFITKSSTGNVRVGINNTNPEFDLDVEGQIRTTRSIISDTAQIRNLDVTNEFVTKGLDLRGPNLINFEETDPTASDFGTIYYPTADNPPRQTQNNRVATTKFVYDVATADNGGRVYVSSVAGIGDDANDGRSAAKPVRTIKKAAQIAYSLQQDTQTPEYVSIICSGGDYVEDNPISLPFNCSLIGDNLRRVIIRPLNMDRHMIKASNETYCAGVVFRDHLDANGSPDFTWKFAYVFDDKQRLMYEPDLEPFEFSPGLENKGRNIFAITFENHTGDNTTLLVGYAVEGGSSSARAIIEAVTFTGPQASPYSSGTITVLMDDDESTFQLAERLYYADVYANIVKTGASPSDSLDVADRESQRPETEVIKHQRYQWVINSETETLRFDGSNATIVDATTNQITVPLHRLNTGFKVEYKVENEGGTAPAGLTSGDSYFVRSIDENTLELYDTAVNALSIQTVTGRRDLGDPGTGDEHTLFTSRISVKDNTFYFPKHGLFTGNGVYYRSSKAGDIGNLVNNGLYYVFKIDDNYFQVCSTQADATNIDISGAAAPVIRSITSIGKGYQRFEKALNVIDISQVDSSLATQQTYKGISFEVTAASRTIEGIPFVGHDYEAGQEVHMYGLPYTAIDFGTSTTTTYTQSGTTLTITVAGTDPSKMNALWPTLVTLAPTNGNGVGVHVTFTGTNPHQDKSFHIATYKTGTLANAQSDYATILGGSSNLGAGVARYNSSTNEVFFVIRASDSATRSGGCNVLDNLGDFNGRKYVTHRIERADGYSLKFVIRGSCSKFATDFDPSGDQQVCSATNYALMSLRNSPYAFEKVEFGADFKEMSKQRDGAETINNNVDFIAIESYAHVKKENNAGTSQTFTRTGTYTCVGDVMTIVCPRGHAVFAKNAYSMTFSGATADGSVLIDDVADHRTATVILSGQSTDSGTVVITVPAPWQTPNSVPPVDRSADGTSLILANKQFIAQEAVDRMLANNPSYQVPTGNQACIDDIVDYCEAMGYNLAYGGNDQVWDGAKYYVDGSHVVGEENESVETFNHARDIAIQVMRNDPVTIQGSHGLTQIRDFTITPDAAGSGQGNKHADARNLIWANRQFIADIAVGRMNADFGFEVANNKVVDAHDLLIANKEFIGAEAYAWELAEDPTLHVPTGNGQDCIDDLVDIVEAVAFNVQHGGNNKVWDAAKYYVGTPHLDDEEFQSVRCIEHAREICKLVLANNTVVVRGDHGKTQSFDLTITHDSSNSAGRYTDADCQDVRASVDTLFEIVHSAILNDSLNAIKKTTPRTFNVPSPQKRTAQNAVYNPATGLMTVTVATDTKDVSAASFTPATGNLELNIGSHTLTTSDSIRIKTGSLNFRCDLDGQATDHYYPRTTIDTSTISGAVYVPSTGVLTVTTSAGHGLTDGDWIRFKDESITFDCQAGTGSHAYPRDTDPVSGKWIQVSNTGGLTFEVNVAISSNTTNHTFVSAVANGLEKKRDRAYEQDLAITAVSGSTITVNVGASSDTSTHVFQNALSGAVILSHGITTAKYLKIATDSMTWTCDMDDGNTTHTYPRATDPANGDGWSQVVAVGVNTIDINVGPTTVDGYDIRDATYNPSTGVIAADIGTNNFKVGQYMRIQPESFAFDCDYGAGTHIFVSGVTDAISDGSTQYTAASGTTYNPTSGQLVAEIASHSLTAATSHTVSTATYNPTTGVMVLTITGHGFSNGDYIKIADNSLTFTCAQDGNASNHSYPRPTDPFSNQWIQISNKTDDTFEVQVLASQPSTNTTTHAFVSATASGVLRATSTVTIADNAVTFTCDADSHNTNHPYPRSGDPQSGKTIGIEAVTGTTITVNVGKASGVGSSSVKSYPRTTLLTDTVESANYQPSTGVMIITMSNHGLDNGEQVKFADDSITFSCLEDNNATNHSYPRSTDYASDRWLTVSNVSTNNFSVQVLGIGNIPSTNTTAHTFVSATADGVSIKKDPFYDTAVEITAIGDSTLTATNAVYVPTEGKITITSANHGLREDSMVKFADDSVTFTCLHDSNATNHSYPRAERKKFTVTDATYNTATGIVTCTFANHGMLVGEYIKVKDNALSFSCTHGDQSTKTYPRTSDPISGKFIPLTAVSTDTFSFQSLDITPSTNTTVHTFVSAVTDGIIQKDPDSNEWRHVKVVNKDTFEVCIATSSNETTHTFVSATTNGISVKDTTISFNSLLSTPSTNVSTHTFVPQAGITPSGVDYNSTTGWMTVTANNHGLVAGNYIKVDQESITFTCTQDSNLTNHAYPRPGDPLFNKSCKIERVTTNTFEFNALQGTTPTNTTVHTFVGAMSGAIKKVGMQSGGDFEHRFISATANGVEVSGTNDDCKDDVVDILQVVSWNLAMGGNDFTYDAANLYVTGAHLEGEEHHSIYALREAQKVAIEVFQNQDVTTGGYTSLAQVKDLTITQDTGLPICNVVISSITTLMNIVEVSIDTGSLSTVTRTASYANRCADVASSITTLTGIITQAIGSTGTPGNLDGVARTYPISDDQCIDDVRHVLRSWMYDLRYGGNSQTILAASKYILGTNINYVNNEVAQTRAVYQKAKDMAVLAIRNQLPAGKFTSIIPFHNSSTTVDINKPECGAAITALTALHTILDNALNTPTSLNSVVNTPPSTMLKDDSGLKKVPMIGDLLDLPVIEASPYIQNASLISFLGASGAEIDGAKVAEPNVPRPGVYQDANGRERATFPRQGKSMVANAFTIISVGGGIGYNILNDGYTQLVSVFVIFGGDGVVVQSGGYASLTNSASNFGTRALKATGFRKDAYEFDIGTVTNVINQTDNNGAQTGRQVIEVGGTTLTNFPIEDYIIKFDGYTNTDPSKEYFILGVEKLSGSIGTQVTANVTTNDGLGIDLNETATGTQIAYSQGNLDTLVGKTIRFHRPSVCNSSSHTWEYCGAGDTYLALPQNGGVGIPANEAVEEAFGQVYTSGTNEFGDFKVGDFVTIFNRTGSISFVGTVSISELSSIKIVGGSITITGFSDSDELGGAFASDSLLPTQAAVKDYITNKLGPYLNQPFSTNAVPSALVQLTTSGKINIEQIPALRPFNITSVASTAERLAIEDASAGDIAIETTSTSFTFAPSAVDTVNNYITIVGHGLATGDILTYFQGTANIGNLADGAQYYVIVHSVGANTTDYIKLATSLSDAQAGTARNLAGQGAGTHTLRTEGAAISYILENDLDSMFIAFTPDATLQFTNAELVTGSASGAQGIITNYDAGVVRDILIDETGAGYTGPPGITISAPGGSGVQATATCTVVNGQVSTVTITEKGSGYFSQPTVTFTAAPTGGTTATAQGNVARIEARLQIDIANNIKFSNVDFMQDESNATIATGTYTHDTYDITVTETNHGFAQGDIVYLNFTSGSSPSGFYDITPVNANEYKVIAAISLLTSGNYERKKIVDVIRTVNTSANDAANWTQLSSTNIDASNIVAGTIDPERLADTGTANSFTFLRGDSSYQNVIQSIKFSTADCMVAESSLSDTSYIEKVEITVAGVGYTVGTYQNIPMLGGNVSISNAGVARATYTVADVTTGGIILTTSNLNQTPESYTPNTTFDVNASTTTGAGLGAQIRFTTDGVGTLSVDLILDGGSGYLGGDTLTFDGPLFGGTVQQPVDITVSTLTSSQAFGVITSVSVVTPGTGYNGDFVLTVPNELGTPSQAATLNAKKGVLPRFFGNASIDVRKANKLTPTTLQAGGSVFGNYGITKFRKNRAEQALGDQTEGGFIVTDNGEVSIDQGAGSKLNADKLDGNEGAFYQNASNLVEGVIDPQRLANTTYNISISGTADFANVLFAETTAPSSANANLVSAANVGMQLALRSNNVNGIPTDAGGDRNGTLTFRRSATGNSVAQIAFSATDNIYLRGNSDLGTVYGNWAKIWHSENDGPPDVNEPRRGTLPGPNADFLDNQQGLWYQQGYNIHDQRTIGILGDAALPTLLGRDKFVANNFYVVSSGEKYQLYIPNFKAATGTNPAGNLSAGGTYTLYADDAAVNNIGTITLDPGGIVETDDTTTDSVYTVVTGSITFVGAYGNKDIRVFGPNPGSKWTVTSSNLLTTGASQVFALSNTEDGALFEMGRAGIVSTPIFDVRSGGLSNDYDVRFEFSGGNASNGNGLMDIKSSSVTINSNTVWHAGNDGVNSQLDAHYVDGYTQNTSNVGNTLVRRESDGDINVQDLYADQGIFTNTGTTILQLADGNGISLGKATTNVLSLKGRQSSSQGYIRFGNDGNSFGYNGTYLSYNNVYFRNGRIGIGQSDPGYSIDSNESVRFGTTSKASDTVVLVNAGDSNKCGFEAYGSNQGTGYLYVGQSNAYGGGIAYNGDNSPAAFASESGDDITFFRRSNGADSRVMKYRYNDSTVHFFGQIRSRVAQGTAPFYVDSTTEVNNLNANLLQGYTALGLPYLKRTTNEWITSNEGQRRFYFANDSHTYYATGDNMYWRNNADYTFASCDGDYGTWNFHEPGSNTTQTSYRVQVQGDNGLNVDSSSVGVSSGQRSVVLRAGGDKTWIDRYGIIKRNRQSISESITINNGDSCFTAGPLTINNGYTIQIASGGSWVII